MPAARLRAARVRAAVTTLCVAGPLALAAAPASASISAPAGFAVTPFAAGNATTNKPDDIARLGRHIFVSWQNGVGPKGEPGPSGATSTVIEYDDAGHVVNQWAPTGRVDGIAADPAAHAIYATANEDGNSTFYVIDPNAAPGAQLRHLTYNDPQGTMTGGSDAVSVDRRGQVYISMSNPSMPGASAVALAQVDSPSGQVTLAPTFPDNMAGVADGNHPGATTTLALTDPDSNAIVPGSSPRFANDFVLDSQGDGQLVFAPAGFNASTPAGQLTQLTLSVPGSTGQPVVDDVRWAAHDGGSMYVVDQGAGIVYRITGPFAAGQAFASQPTDPSNPPLQSDVVGVNLNDGTESAFATGFNSPKGLLYVTPSEDRRDHGSGGQGGGEQSGGQGGGRPER
jgi:hypothetical protein